MLLHGIGARGDTKCQNLTVLLKKGSEYPKNEKLLLNLSNIKVYFFRIESILSKTFLKKLFNYRLYLRNVLGK